MNMNNDFNNDDIFSIFSTTYTDTHFAGKMLGEYNLKNQNHLLALMNSLVLTFTYFCKLSNRYITKYENNDHLFLDCYIKRVFLYFNVFSTNRM